MLGQYPDKDAQRDAIHAAIIPLVASEKMYAGQHIALTGDGRATLRGVLIGIVDPFLPSPVMPGDRFYAVLYPGTVTGMRHHWTHPAFDVDTFVGTSQESELWLRGFAERFQMTYEEVIDPNGELVTGEYIRTIIDGDGGETLRDQWYDEKDDFFRHYEIVTGRTVTESNQGGFTCSC